jgi:cytochrome o ubiquinol oxidase subunit 1
MMFGKLSLSAIPFHEPIIMITLTCVALGGWRCSVRSRTSRSGATCGPSGYLGRPQSIGVMYSLVALIMLLRGFADAVMMRTQLAVATNGSTGFLPPSTTTRSSPPTA